MGVEARMAREPGLHLGLFMGGVAPEDFEGWTARRPSSYTRRVYPDVLLPQPNTLYG
jgi:hypothetical protein